MIDRLIQDFTQRPDIFHSFRSRFSGQEVMPETPWLLLGGAVAAALIGAMVYQWIVQRRARAVHAPWRLFVKILRNLPLSWRQRRRLFQLALVGQRSAPTAILLTPTVFAQAAGVYLTARAHKAAFADYHRELSELSQQLFGESLAP